MNNRITILNVTTNNEDELLLEVENSLPLKEYTASGQMLVDSARFSFVYLIENKHSYTYIIIPEAVWNDLLKVSKNSIPVFLTNGNEKLLLTQFHEEFVYLIGNISGNSNYGEEMVAKVEAVFN